ncbi:50S ribosomal protein L35 [candidate division WOR-3 bacterium]|nr:50S ribosomal protein L35 [candidate division WOR-3 bacterium]
MPKIKSKRSARNRFRVTKKGKVMRYKAGRSHLLAKRNRKAKRQLSGSFALSSADTKRIRNLIS